MENNAAEDRVTITTRGTAMDKAGMSRKEKKAKKPRREHAAYD